MTSPHRRRNKKFDIEGHAHFLTCSCYKRMPLLTNDSWRMMLAEAIRAACLKHDVALWAYVFMPEHIHLLLKPQRSNYSLAAYEHDFKLASSRRIITALAKSRSKLLEKLAIDKPGKKRAYRFWQRGGGHDLNIWTMRKAVEKAEYCHWNPVKRRLVKSPEQWRYSSFRWLILNQRDGQPLDVDDWKEDVSGPASVPACV